MVVAASGFERCTAGRRRGNGAVDQFKGGNVRDRNPGNACSDAPGAAGAGVANGTDLTQIDENVVETARSC